MITEIIRFTNQYPQVRVMVTSRIIGYKAQRLRDAQFRHFTLQDFEAEQIQAFVQKWHDLAFGNQPDKPRLQNRLQRAINESPAIRELAGNPLLLTMMAILNRNRELPRERAELYDEASRVLLHEWDIEKGLPPDEKLSPDTITRKEKQAMLRRVAYQMQAAPQGLAGNLINGDELEQILAGYLETLQEIEKPRTVSRLIIKQLRERNFILCFSGADCYSFVHRTFLEFFCAWEFVWQFKEKQALSIEELKTEVFGKHWQEESWHEVLRLISAMIDEQFVGEIIDYLIRQDGKTAKFRNLFLAAKCLTEVRTRSQISETATQLLDQLKSLCKWVDYKQIKNQKQFSLITEIQTQAVTTISSTWKEDSKTLPWLISRLAQNNVLSVRQAILQEIVQTYKEHPDTLKLLSYCAQFHNNSNVRIAIIQEIIKGWKNHPDTLSLLKIRAYLDNSSRVREMLLKELIHNWHYDTQIISLKIRAQYDENPQIRIAELQTLVRTCKDEPETLAFIKKCVKSDRNVTVRKFALQELARGWKDKPNTLDFIKKCVQSDRDVSVRKFALQELVRGWKNDPNTLGFIKFFILSNSDASVRQFALHELARCWRNEPDTLAFLKSYVHSNGIKIVPELAIPELARGWKDEPDTLAFLKRCAQYSSATVRQSALKELARGWTDDHDILTFIKKRALFDRSPTVREVAIQALALTGIKDSSMFSFLCYFVVKYNFKFYNKVYDTNARKTGIKIIVKQYHHYPQTLKLLQNLIAYDADPNVQRFAREQLDKLRQKPTNAHPPQTPQ